MLDRPRREGPWIVAAILVVVGGMVVATVTSPRDPRTLTTDELVATILADGFPLAWGDRVRDGIAALEERPRPERLALAARLVVAAEPPRRALAIVVFAALVRDGTDGEREELEHQVLGLLDDTDVQVRRQALELAAMLCTSEGDRAVPARVFAVIRELLASSDAQHRGTALAVAIPFGKRLAPLRKDLIEFLRRDQDAGRRFMATIALGRVRPVDGALQELRRGLLADAEAKVRLAAAVWFTQSPAGGAAAVPRLLALAKSPDEDVDTRREAVSALARLVTDRETATDVLAVLLGLRTEIADHGMAGWCSDVGRVSAVLAGSPAADGALAVLAEVGRAEAHRTPVLAARARVAAAHRSQPFEAESLAALRAFVAEWYESAREIAEFATSPEPGAEDAVEAMVELSAWPASGVRADEIKPLLELVAGTKHEWTRDWAQEQLQRLKQ
ncbi:MAG: hypothetical protein WAT39_14835 [Planctomycetota bacterium]